jgi:hypothetical protein
VENENPGEPGSRVPKIGPLGAVAIALGLIAVGVGVAFLIAARADTTVGALAREIAGGAVVGVVGGVFVFRWGANKVRTGWVASPAISSYPRHAIVWSSIGAAMLLLIGPAEVQAAVLVAVLAWSATMTLLMSVWIARWRRLHRPG